MKNDYTVFEYLYRDAGNYKAYGALLLQGKATEQDLNRLRELLNDGQWFIAEQVNIPPLFDELWKYSDGATEDDLPFHEFLEVRQANQNDFSELKLFGGFNDFNELLGNFERVNNCWDIAQSTCGGY